MEYHKVILGFLLLGAWSYAVDGRALDPPLQAVQSFNISIPERCINKTKTAVTCTDVVGELFLLPHPDDCQLFYYCVSPSPTPICRQCPDGLHFNPTAHVCDRPERAGCKSPKSFKRQSTDISTAYSKSKVHVADKDMKSQSLTYPTI